MSLSAELAPLESYAALPETDLVRLSPAGTQLAVVSHLRDEGEDIVQVDVFDPASGANRTALVRSSNASEVLDVIWLNESRLLVEINNKSSILVDLQTGEFDELNKQMFGSYPWRLVSWISGDKPVIFGEFGTQDEDRLWQIDGISGDRITVDRGRQKALNTNWYADQQGNYRLKRHIYEDHVEYELAAPGTEDFELVWDLKPLDPRMFHPETFTPDGQHLIALRQVGDTVGLVKMDLDAPNAEPELLLQFADYDLSGTALFDLPGRRGNVIGFTVPWLQKSIVWAEPYAGLLAQVQKVLPDASLQFEEIHRESGQYVVLASQRGLPGIFYIGNFREGTLAPLLPRRRAFATISPPPVPYVQVEIGTADTGPLRGNFYAVPDGIETRGGAIFTHSGDWSEERDGFNALAQMLVSRGFAVLQVQDPHPGYWFNTETPMVGAFGGGLRAWSERIDAHLLAAGDWMAAQGFSPAQTCLVGDWVGGSIAINALALHPGKFGCAIATSAPEDFGDWLSAARGWGAEIYTTSYEKVFGISSKEARALSPVALIDRIEQPVLMIDFYKSGWGDATAAMIAELKRNGVAGEYHELDYKIFYRITPEIRRDTFSLIEKFLDSNFPRSM